MEGLPKLGEDLLTWEPAGQQSTRQQRDWQHRQDRVRAAAEIRDCDQHRQHHEGEGRQERLGE